MIKLQKTKVCGWEEAIRGMRNPMNSWAKSDSMFDFKEHCCDEFGEFEIRQACSIGKNDYSLMKRLRDAGTDHRKFMRMIAVYVDVTAPLYW